MPTDNPMTAILLPEGGLEAMSRRRYQCPKPRIRGQWWVIDVYRDVWENGAIRRKHTTERLCVKDTPERQVAKIRDEYLRPTNQGLQGVGGATNFQYYVESTYNKAHLPLLASSTRSRYRGIIKKYLVPAFGKLSLRDVTALGVQQYFASFTTAGLQHETLDKIRDVLASILSTAVRYGLIVTNPCEGIQLPRLKRGKRAKPYITPQQFAALVDMIQ